jgi:pimeloyl-ACP methyl ester carboxylesterase
MNTLVLVHGFMGGSLQWQGQRAALGAEYNVITPDLPGYGENAHLTAPDNITDFAKWVLADLSDRGIEKFHVLGHSMGGMIVQEMARLAPARVARLILYGTGAIGVLPGRFEPIGVSKERARADGPRATARRIAATWFLEREAASAYAQCAAIAERSSLQAMESGLTAMQEWSGLSYLPDVGQKTLVIWGDHDRTYPWSQTAQLWQSIQDADLAVIPGCAHAVHLEKPHLFNTVLGDFLKS